MIAEEGIPEKGINLSKVYDIDIWSRKDSSFE